MSFDYALPPGRIAAYPAEPRESARLLRLGRSGGPLGHHRVSDLPGLLGPGDLLLANDTRVLQARLQARRPSGGRVEVVLVRPLEDGTWKALVRSRGRVKPGDRLEVGEAALRVEGHDGPDWRLRVEGEDPLRMMERAGEAPLPPYLGRGAEPGDRDRYQTSFAARPGAVAAPTAGFHLTAALRERLKGRGVAWATLTLHVGPGTFRTVAGAPPDPEWYEIPEGTLEAVRAARRVVAVGTTSARALETWASTGKASGWTELVVAPGFAFRATGALLTNFHLPGTSLLALACAFGGVERVLSAYREAVDGGYRFYSFGDAMLID